MDMILNFAPTGMIPTKQMTPYAAVGIQEIIEDVHAAYELGITLVHLHARDEVTEEPTYRADVYAKLIEGIREFSKDLIVCVSLSGRTFQEFEKRAAPLQLDGDLKPDMGSLTLSSVNFPQVASVNSPQMIQALATEMQRRGILAELEVFDVGMINYAKYLESKGLLQPPHYFNLLLGSIAGAQADLLPAGLMIRDLPPGSLWSFAGIGDDQLTMNALAVAASGGVRVGLEDNIWYDRGRTRLARNIDLVRRIHQLAEVLERRIMPPQELRRCLQLEAGNGRYGRRSAMAANAKAPAIA
ncbi:MAG: 3-keto-5-aminohexanoate cleavage protein [Candidatus Competibacteraceae bacterium]